MLSIVCKKGQKRGENFDELAKEGGGFILNNVDISMLFLQNLEPASVSFRASPF